MFIKAATPPLSAGLGQSVGLLVMCSGGKGFFRFVSCRNKAEVSSCLHASCCGSEFDSKQALKVWATPCSHTPPPPVAASSWKPAQLAPLSWEGWSCLGGPNWFCQRVVRRWINHGGRGSRPDELRHNLVALVTPSFFLQLSRRRHSGE